GIGIGIDFFIMAAQQLIAEPYYKIVTARCRENCAEKQIPLTNSHKIAAQVASGCWHRPGRHRDD
ncbi:MAG TPA: hypothetical protein DDY14_07425, partial [Chromatiaceae bacterium]|nr:hypothetical protein [Chromatiaceae bacterium]